MMLVGFIAIALAAVAALVQSALATLQAWENRRFARSRMRSAGNVTSTRRVLLIAPCKGLDLELEQNLGPLLAQEHDHYAIRFVVESSDDPACDAIRRVIAAHPGREAALIVAGRADDTGQKVHNLRAATADLPGDVEILAFVDSDARPGPAWLRTLTRRLDRIEIGAATGYRWFVPQRTSLANLLLYSINATVASMLGPGGHHLVWGGSWAMRRDVFESLGIHAAWKGALSDDLVVSRLLRDADLRIEFEPQCMIASPVDMRLGQFAEFMRRQYALTRIYTPNYWWFALATMVLVAAAFWGALAMTIAGVASDAWWTPAVAALALTLYAGHVVRGWLRQQAGRVCLPQRDAGLRTARRFDTWCGPLTAAVNVVGLVSSMFGSQITWRGITYRMHRGGRIDIVARDGVATSGAASADGPLRDAA